MPKDQLRLDLLPTFGWGGSRPGAGRKSASGEPGISHRRALAIDLRTPAHATLRVRPHVWNLRSRRSFSIISAALRGVLERADFRVVHFSVQGNHLHLIVEADDARSLAGGMRAIGGRIAIGLNLMMGRKGPVFADRYHAHALRTPSEVRNALAYVRGNFASHAARRGERIDAALADPFSSAAQVCADGLPPPVSEPRTWLLAAATSDRRSLGPASFPADGVAPSDDIFSSQISPKIRRRPHRGPTVA
jgi:REP element-mobilizing transposase RayT